MTREKAEKACELLRQIERLEELLRMDADPLRAFINENYSGYGKLIVGPRLALIIPNELIKDYVSQYVDYSEKEIAKLKDQLDSL